MNKEYLSYLFKSKKSLCVVTGLLYVLSYIIFFSMDGLDSGRAIAGLASSCFILGIMCYVLVPIVFSYVHNKKAVDSYFSLPVSRKEVLITTQIFIDLLIIVPFVILSIITLVLALNTGHIESLLAYVVFVLIAIVGVIAVVMFETALFLEANSTFDGVVMIFAYLLMPLLIFFAIDSFQSSYIAGLTPLSDENLISYLSLPVAIISGELINGDAACFDEGVVATIPLALIICILWHVVVSVISLKKNYIERKVERAETVSNGFFSYPFVIYFYAFTLLFISTTSFYSNKGIINNDIILSYFFIFVCFAVATFVYRRKISIKAKDIAFFVASIAIVLVLSFAANKTKGFGLSYAYDHNPRNYFVRINDYRYNQEPFKEEDEIDKIVKKAYSDFDQYSFGVDGIIKEKDLEASKEAIAIIEKLREGAIEAQYDRQPISTNFLEIITNINEETYEYGYFSTVDESNDSEQAYYRYAPKVTLDELKILNKYFEVYFEVWNNSEHGYFEEITLDKLLELAK